MNYSQTDFGNLGYEIRRDSAAAGPGEGGAECCTTLPLPGRPRRALGWLLLWLVMVMASTAACHKGDGAGNDADPAIRSLLARQVERWNAGDLVGFMDGYERSPALRFQSGGDVQLGWQNVLDRYRRRYGNDRVGMGTLTFSELQVEPLAPASALAYGRWRVQGAGGAAGELSGLFTLILRKQADGWRIRFDHTSAR
jgi:beta-aspartyl-peptidase (threonine type)